MQVRIPPFSSFSFITNRLALAELCWRIHDQCTGPRVLIFLGPGLDAYSESSAFDGEALRIASRSMLPAAASGLAVASCYALVNSRCDLGPDF